MLPVGILMAFAAMRWLGLGANIMSLGGIAIAIGAMIDGAIVMIEKAHKHLERAEPDQPRAQILIEAAKQVGPALFFSLLIITVSFMPIFTLDRRKDGCSARSPIPRPFDGRGGHPVGDTGAGADVLFIRGTSSRKRRTPSTGR